MNTMIVAAFKNHYESQAVINAMPTAAPGNAPRLDLPDGLRPVEFTEKLRGDHGTTLNHEAMG